ARPVTPSGPWEPARAAKSSRGWNNGRGTGCSMRCFHPFAVLIVILLAGCGGKSEPLTAHGKPVAHWLDELEAPDPRARKKAVVALGHVGKADPAAVPALAGAVKDRDAGVRAAAVLALLNLGPDAREAVPALSEARNDSDAKVRAYAAKALAKVGGGDGGGWHFPQILAAGRPLPDTIQVGAGRATRGVPLPSGPAADILGGGKAPVPTSDEEPVTMNSHFLRRLTLVVLGLAAAPGL